MSPCSDQPEPALFELPPPAGTAINARLALLRSDGRCAILCGATPLQVWEEGDRIAERVAMHTVVTAGHATRRDVARAFGVHENTVQRLVRQGLDRVVPAKPGPKGPRKLLPGVRDQILEGHRRGLSRRQLQHWLREEHGIALSLPALQGVVQPRKPERVAQSMLELSPDAESVAPASMVDEAEESEPEVLPADTDAPSVRSGIDAPVFLPEADHGRYMGLTLYYPALAAIGMLEAAKQTLRLRLSERFGVRAVVLTLFFLSLLRKTTLESAKHLRRLEFGAVVGTERAPCVKTLRRKLLELGALEQAGELGRELARRWMANALVWTTHLYVDGHVKVYSGKRRLEEVWNAQRRMPLPGVLSYFVGDQRGRPLVVVSEGVSPSLAKSLPAVVGAVREVTGERPLTLIFDRGGYDGKVFAWLQEQHIDFITYQRGGVNLPRDRFRRRQTHFEGKRVTLEIAEDSVKVSRSGPWRRLVVRARTGHQTPILTSLGDEVTATRIANLMFARWRQENFFRYMRQHHGLDTLVSHAWRDASEQTIPNPERKRLERELAAKRAELRRLQAELGAAVLDGAAPPRLRQDATRRGAALETEIATLMLQRRIAPKRVTVAAAGRVREVMELERKHLVDHIKVAAYNAEEWLLERLMRHYRNPHDVRDLLRACAALPGSIHTAADAVIVTLEPPDTPAHRVALRGLCADLNELTTPFPGTDLPVRYDVGIHHSEQAA